jgi:Type IV secretory pathway, TrbF components
MGVKDLIKSPDSAGYEPQEDPETPWDKAAQIAEGRLGLAIQTAKHWRLAFFALTVVVIFLVAGLIIQNARSTIEPYIVAVGTDGAVLDVGMVKNSRSANDAEKGYFLSEFVQDTRGLTLDPVVNKRAWSKAYKYLSAAATTKMDDITKAEKTFDMFGKQTIDVQVNVVVPMTNDTYQVRWVETTYNLEGQRKSSRKMTGLFTIEIRKPTNEKELRINPLGIIIKDFSWQAEI